MKSFSGLIFASSLFLLFSCKKETVQSRCINKSKINPELMCTMQYEPVCGCDQKTYGNACEARKSGVQKWTMGECPD